jgi:putative hydrolase of the HAD superfamily
MTTRATSSDLAAGLARLSPRRAVIFDLDDTLYAERSFAFSGFATVDRFLYDNYGIHLYDRFVEAYRAGIRSDLFRQCLSAQFPCLSDVLLRQVTHIFWSHDPRIVLHQDACIALSLLAARGVKTGIVTTGNGAIQRRKIERLRLTEYVNAVIHDDDLFGPHVPGQPGEDAFMLIALNLDIESQEMLFVGDNPLTDFALPRRLGIPTIRIRRRGGEYFDREPATPAATPDYTIASLEELALCLTPTAHHAEQP